MNANYTEICKVDNLEADFQQVELHAHFSEFFTILLWNIKIQILQRNMKTLNQKFQKITLL